MTEPRVVSGLEAAARTGVQGAVVSIGNFDGVHLGHRALLARMRELAAEAGRPAVVVTFFPPARVFFAGGQYLSSAAEKAALLTEFSPDLIVMIRFDEAFSLTSKEEFLEGLARLEPSGFVVGGDFRFGHGRAGSVADLEGVARVERFELVELDGRPVGSSRVRELLAAGDVEAANRLLGAPYLAGGRVVEGARRGRTIGFPTANVELDDMKARPPGVFAVTVEAAGETYGGMANVGPRPSFPDEPPALEVNLFDFESDLYGQEITVRFVAKLREQVRFGSLDELKRQLAADERAARAALAGR